MSKQHSTVLTFILGDWLACLLAWLLFFAYRKKVETGIVDVHQTVQDPKLLLGLAVIPICWIFLFWFCGNYNDLIRRTRLTVVYESFIAVFIGSLVMLFTVITDDISLDYISYFQSFLIVFLIHFISLVLGRNLVVTGLESQLKKGKLRLNTLYISDKPGLSKVKLNFPVFQNVVRKIGFNEIGKLPEYLETDKIEDVIIDIGKKDRALEVLNSFGWYEDMVRIQISDRTYDGLKGFIKIFPLIAGGTITLKTQTLTPLEQNIKRIADLTISFLALVLLSPLMFLIWIRVKQSSPGPVIFKQKRVGLRGKKFWIRKFRSMYQDAESDGPRLSDDEDERCTPWGRTMRKWRIDEIPQFINVLKGEMSLVGPRPERAYYIGEIKKQVPSYDKILQVRPGITSWGQIKYGYASSIPQMVQRLRYDMLYIDNRSLILDIKILLYTIGVILQGKGK